MSAHALCDTPNVVNNDNKRIHPVQGEVYDLFINARRRILTSLIETTQGLPSNSNPVGRASLLPASHGGFQPRVSNFHPQFSFFHFPCRTPPPNETNPPPTLDSRHLPSSIFHLPSSISHLPS